jgi:hypothetical protein
MLNQIFDPKAHFLYSAMMTKLNEPKQGGRFIRPKKLYRGLTQGQYFFVVASSLQEARLLALLSASSMSVSGGMSKETMMNFLQLPDELQIGILEDMSKATNESFIWGILFLGDQNSDAKLSLPLDPQVLFRHEVSAGVLFPAEETTITINCLPKNVHQDSLSGGILVKSADITVSAPVRSWATLPYQIIGLT